MSDTLSDTYSNLKYRNVCIMCRGFVLNQLILKIFNSQQSVYITSHEHFNGQLKKNSGAAFAFQNVIITLLYILYYAMC